MTQKNGSTAFMNRHGPIAQAVEELLPAHIMSLAIDQLYKEGFEIRLDTREYLNTSMMTVLKKHPGQHMTIAKKADTIAGDIMRHVNLEDAKTALLAASFMILKLVEEKLYLDEQNQSVLSALMIVADARDDENPDNAHLVPAAEKKAKLMLDEALLQGLYCHTVVPN